MTEQVAVSGGEDGAKPRPTTLNIPAALVIAGFPILGYAGAFAFEAGRCQYFRLPFEFIKLDLTTGFIVALSVVGFGLWFAAMFFDLVTLQRLPHNHFKRMAPAIGLSLTIMLLAGALLNYLLYTLTVVVVILGLYRVHGRVQNETPEQALAAQLRWRGLYGLWGDYAELLGQRPFIYMFVALNLFAAAYNVGFFAASEQSSFLTSGNYVVVAMYRDTFIALKGSAVPDGYALGPDMKLFRVSDISPLYLKPATLQRVLRPGQRGWLAEMLFK